MEWEIDPFTMKHFSGGLYNKNLSSKFNLHSIFSRDLKEWTVKDSKVYLLSYNMHVQWPVLIWLETRIRYVYIIRSYYFISLQLYNVCFFYVIRIQPSMLIEENVPIYQGYLHPRYYVLIATEHNTSDADITWRSRSLVDTLAVIVRL